MDREPYDLTAERYKLLYHKTFACLEDVVRMAEKAMLELEELRLSMGEGSGEE